MKPSTVIFVIDLPSNVLSGCSESVSTQYAQVIKLAVMRVLYSSLDLSGEWGYKFFDSSESAHGGSASKSEHVYPLDSNSIDVFTAALKENIRQKRLSSTNTNKITASRSFIQRIVSAIGHIFVDFHLTQSHVLSATTATGTLIALLAPCPHSLAELYAALTSESDYSVQSTSLTDPLDRKNVAIVTNQKLQKFFSSIGEKLLSVQSQLMWLDIFESVTEIAGSVSFAPFDPRKVLQNDALVTQPFSSISTAPGFDIVAAFLAEMNQGETATLVSFQSALLLDASLLFPMRSLLMEHVLSTETLLDRTIHVSSTPASIVVAEKTSRSTPTSSQKAPSTPNSSFSSNDGDSNSSSTFQTICDGLKLRIAQPKDPEETLDAQENTDNDGSKPTNMRLHFGKDDRKSHILSLPSANASIRDSNATEEVPPLVRLAIRGVLRNEFVNPSWISGDCMLLVPSIDPTLEHRTRGPQGSTSPRKSQARAKQMIAQFSAFLSILSLEDSCVVVDMTAPAPASAVGNVTALLLPLTATNAILMPLHESIHISLSLLQAFASPSSHSSSQHANTSRRMPTRRTASAGVVSDPNSHSSQLKLSTRSLYPPSFYHATKCARLESESQSTHALPSLCFFEKDTVESCSIESTTLKKLNLLPQASPMPPTTNHPLSRVASAYIASLRKGSHYNTNVLSRSVEKQKQRQEQASDDSVEFASDPDDDEQQTSDVIPAVAELISLYERLVTGVEESTNLKKSAQNLHNAHPETRLRMFLEEAMSDANRFGFEHNPSLVLEAATNRLWKSLATLMEMTDDIPVPHRVRETRLQVALRLELTGRLKSSEKKSSSPKRGASTATGSRSKTQQSKRNSFVSKVELEPKHRSDVLRLLRSIRILMDAENEGGFMEYMTTAVIDNYQHVCPWTLKWLWRQMELETSLLPESLSTLLADEPERQQETENQVTRRQTRRSTSIASGWGTESPRRGKRKRASLSTVEDLEKPFTATMGEIDSDADIFVASQESLEKPRSPKIRKTAETSVEPEVRCEIDPTANNPNLPRTTRSGALLSRMRSQNNTAGLPTPGLPGDSVSSSSSSSGLSTPNSLAAPRAFKAVGQLAFSPEDIMNKVKGLSTSHANLPKPETQVRYIPKRPKSPPKSPPRPIRSTSHSQLFRK